MSEEYGDRKNILFRDFEVVVNVTSSTLRSSARAISPCYVHVSGILTRHQNPQELLIRSIVALY
jgi:hypothetical protein